MRSVFMLFSAGALLKRLTQMYDEKMVYFFQE